VDVLEIIIMGQACPNLEKMELSIYSWDLNLQVRPEIADIIRLQDKFLYTNVKRSKALQLL
jgi:hypothetical protein